MARTPKTTGEHDQRVGAYFDRASVTFDTFYDCKRTKLMQWVDRKYRSDIFERFRIAFETLQPMEGKSLLDVGCGSGPYCVEAVRRGARRVVGLDMAPGMLDLARRRAEATGAADRCKFVLGTFPKDAPRETFDYAVVMGVMDYIADPAAFLRALAQCVRSKAALSFPSQHWFRTPLRKFRYWLKRCPVYFYDAGEVERLMRDAGFQDVHVEKIPGAGMDFVGTGRGAAGP
jgi:cyclopropane fatty-acyl-phospholipid synthase-like methyltransferase